MTDTPAGTPIDGGRAMTGTPRVVAGVDGCRAGWLVVEWTIDVGPQADRADRADRPEADRADGPAWSASPADRIGPIPLPQASVQPDLEDLVRRLRRGQVASVAVDMPIGLLDTQPRPCDVEARRLLGPRRSSVFPTPVRSTLDAADYEDACRLSRRDSGKALSKQAYNLLPKIRQLDRLVMPADQERLVEAHPELAFARLNGRPLEQAKRTEAGRVLRRRLLAERDPALADLIDRFDRLPTLDLIDAAALAVTAAHVVARSEHRLGTGADRRGLATRVVY